jgi:hypothetical protein
VAQSETHLNRPHGISSGQAPTWINPVDRESLRAAGAAGLILRLPQERLGEGEGPQPGADPAVSYVDHYAFLGVLPDEDGDVADITGLYAARFGVPPVGKRVFIQTLQQLNGWRDRPQTTSARVLAP